MLARLFLACICLFILSGCGGGGSSDPATFSQIPVETELAISGVTEGAVISRDYLYVTVDRSKSVFRNYTCIEYTLDTQLGGYKPALFDDPDNKNIKRLTIPVSTEGLHQFAIRGVLRADPGDRLVHRELGKTFNFNVQYQLGNVAKGKYVGDRTVYKAPFTSFSGMRVDFVTYSTSRSGNNLATGGVMLTDMLGNVSSYAGSTNIAAAISANQSHTTVSYLMNSAQEFLRASGTGYNHFMELLLLQGPQGLNQIADRQGDLLLYRADTGSRVLSAQCTSLRGFLGSSPEKQATFTLQSFDNVNFFGHLRLWNKNSLRVWTYQVAGYATATGLSRNGSLTLWLSTSNSPLDDFLLSVTPYPDAYNLVNPTGAPLSRQPGFLTVDTDADGSLVINQLSLNFDDIYDAAANSITMKASYKP